ncbi:hypothetical protein BGZ68_010576, partial [Mortierella alpina]
MTKKSKTAALGHDEHGDNQSVSSQHLRKRDKFLNMFRSDKPKVHTNVSVARPESKGHRTNSVSIKAGDAHISAVSSIAVSCSDASTPPMIEEAKVRLDIFSTNTARPAVRIAVPKLGARIDNTPQLALCSSLIPKSPALSPCSESGFEFNLLQMEEASQATPIEGASNDWAKAIEQNPIEQSHVRWLLERMVEEFAKDAVKGSAVVNEVILLGPVLDYEHYRKLLNCFIHEFEKAIILDEDLLHGLVQLVQ